MKIIYFDYWTRGIRHFTPVFQVLAALKIESLLLHLGSWRDPAVPDIEVINDIVCKDIRHYGNNLRRALLQEKPDVVFMLNTTLTVDRTINRLCRTMGIKIVYMMHGIKPVGHDLDQFITHQNRHWNFFRRLQKIPKYAGLCSAYLAAIGRDRLFELLYPSTYGHFIQLITSPGAAHERPWPHKDIYCDLALVYAKVYSDSLIKEAAYPIDRVKVIGNPNLDSAFLLLSDTTLQQQASVLISDIGVPSGRRAAVYMEDAFVEQGIGGWTEETRISLLKQIAQATNNAGLDLIIKMHPNSNPVPVQKTFSNLPDVHVILKTDLAALVWGCVATIGHISTTLMLPIAMKRPLIVPTWAPGLEKFSYYIGAGAAINASTPNELTRILRAPEEANDSIIRGLSKFIDQYLTYTDGQSLNRIIDHLLACATNK